MEEGPISRPEAGAPQGGVISPLLVNIYLHYVLDCWFQEEVQPRMRGRAYLIRFADDAVIGFSDKADAERVLAVLPKRFERFGLRLHEQKTRLVDFRRPAVSAPLPGSSRREPESFDFLGFTHYWAISRKGRWVIKHKTAAKRFVRRVRAIHEFCRANLHRPLAEQQQALNRKLRGHCSYYGITSNSRALGAFRYRIMRTWRYWLSRRNRKRVMT